MIVNNLKIRKIILIVFKVFFVGLILQFFLQTFVTFGLGWNNIFWKVVWAWKEILIILGCGFLVYIFAKEIDYKNIK